MKKIKSKTVEESSNKDIVNSETPNLISMEFRFVGHVSMTNNNQNNHKRQQLIWII